MDTKYDNTRIKSVSQTQRIFADTNHLGRQTFSSKNGFDGHTGKNNFRKALKLRDKLMRFKLHKETLEEYSNMNLIPKGLLVHLTPSFGKDDPDFMSNWEHILHTCSFNLMKLVIKQCDKICLNVEQNLVIESNTMEDCMNDPEQLETVHNKIDLIIEKRKCHIKKIKQKKIRRDIHLKTKRVRSRDSDLKVTDQTEHNDTIQWDLDSDQMKEVNHQTQTDWSINFTRTIENIAASSSKTTSLCDTADIISTENVYRSPVDIFQPRSRTFYTPEKQPPKTQGLKSPDFHIPEFFLQTPPATI